jgi:hypothetical protein
MKEVNSRIGYRYWLFACYSAIAVRCEFGLRRPAAVAELHVRDADATRVPSAVTIGE